MNAIPATTHTGQQTGEERAERITKALLAARATIIGELDAADNPNAGMDFVEVTLLLAELAVTGNGKLPREQAYQNCMAFVRELAEALKPQPTQMLM